MTPTANPKETNESTSSAPPQVEYQCLEHVPRESGETRGEQALRLVRRHMYWAMGGSLIPLPIVDKVAVTGVQIKLLKDLSELYEVPFSESALAKVIAALVAGLGSMQVAKAVATSGLKAIPFAGPLLALLSYPVFSGALTYALGKVFVMHYELGGSLLTFNVEQARNYFARQFSEGKLVVAQFYKG